MQMLTQMLILFKNMTTLEQMQLFVLPVLHVFFHLVMYKRINKVEAYLML